MSDPRPLAARIEAALTPAVRMNAVCAVVEAQQRYDATSETGTHEDYQRVGFEAWRAVLTAALLAALEEHVINVTSHHVPDIGNMIVTELSADQTSGETVEYRPDEPPDGESYPEEG